MKVDPFGFVSMLRDLFPIRGCRKDPKSKLFGRLGNALD